ncbi:4Fe-4S binding protein [Methanolobus vulcani]|uniref:4Fe-4S binding protein n=1 Tax=Methanolobus vulcani TaxID=38026 RepID=UPI001E4FEAEA|nr:CoB--CoM heterodisulfide reductase iron-sulfur subunit A family protein [Methanolobus vulcani]
MAQSEINDDTKNTDEPRIGVFICECGVNIGGVIDCHAVADYAGTLPDVIRSSVNKYTCSDSGQSEIKQAIKDNNLNRVLVAACTPKTHEPIFRACVEEAGLNPYLFEFVNIREHCSWIHMQEKEAATEKACELVRMGVSRASKLEPLQSNEVPVTNTALVIGAGVAGMQSALDIADMGYKVYLVEKNPSIGGKMAQLDKTFPTNDCSICILGPKMVEVARNKNIELMTYSEVEEVDGYVGNFKVKVRHKARYVDVNTCTGCGLCVEKCPVEVPNTEFNEGIGTRKAIYVPFPQAVPLRAVIDKSVCIDCGACSRACSSNSIIMEQEDTFSELDIGVIVVTAGFDVYDPEPTHDFGYGLYDNVITGMELERLINASGPTMGKVVRPSDVKPPKKVGFIQCVGSRDKKRNRYCSSFCCMYALKDAQLIREKYPDSEVYIMYMDMRTPFRNYEEFYDRARDMGIRFIRGKPGKVTENEDNGLKVRVEDTLTNDIIDLDLDLLVLSVGAVSSESTERIRQILKVSRAADGFLMEAHPKLKPVDTTLDGIFIGGVSQGPKDIPYSVSQGSACAARATRYLAQGKAITEGITVEVNPDICVACGICVPMCPFQALSIEDGKLNIIKALCKGCGTCAVACPTGALQQNHFRNDQLLAQVKNVFTFEE